MNQLKRLLNSLKMNDTLYYLTYLLNPIMPFQGQWCYRGSNVTFAECNITIPISSCTQCTLSGLINQTRTELCATCLTNSPDKTGLSHEMIFNMTERTYSTLWLLNCGRENCNTPAVSGSIREKSYIYFDFDEFFNIDNKSISILSMNKMTLFFIIFLIKIFHSMIVNIKLI
ncbi:unnamed protein product [Rotaria sordida]|uniref:Uncharacterized protein n=1 Tax=Rotaria sordida TaxID=392033 RepID=A0A813UN30_9BILA|nr:unnamed protein product [Rotaria sordida]CAF3554647.1 unnamed protein product [Rotaria sordida]